MHEQSFDLLRFLKGAAGLEKLSHALASGKRCVAVGSVGSSTALSAGLIARRTQRPLLLVVAHLDDADEAQEELSCCGVACVKIPALEASAAEGGGADLIAARVRLAHELPTLQGSERGSVVVASIQALMQGVQPPGSSQRLIRRVRTGERLVPQQLVAWLSEAGYRRVDAIEEPGEFSVRGGIVDIFPISPASLEERDGVLRAVGGGGSGGEPVPVRLDYFGDEVERISEIDPDTLASDRMVAGIELIAADFGQTLRDDSNVCFAELMPAGFITMLAETMEVVEQARGYYERVTDPKGIFGPPAVLKVLESKSHAMCEVNQFSAGASATEARVELPWASVPAFSQEAGEAVHDLVMLTRVEPISRVVVVCQNEGERTRFVDLLAQHVMDEARTAEENKAASKDPGKAAERARALQAISELPTVPMVETVVGYLHRGFVLQRDEAGATTSIVSLALVPYHELLGRFGVRRSARVVRASRAMDTFLDFDEGDYVVHADHGIAKYVGLRLMMPRELPIAQRRLDLIQAFDKQGFDKSGLDKRGLNKTSPEPEEYLILEFASASKLYVPATQIDKVQKYVGGFSGKPQLSVLGGQRWQTQKERTAESVRDLAGEMLRVRAAREHLPGLSFPNDTQWQQEFEAAFAYEETPDQLAALQEIKRDMHASRPMDRLICGDVGFGKTELAIRGAFKACEFGKQVAVLVPTTVLAEQHERTFKSRFAGYPFRVESISRFKSDAQVREVLKDLRKGSVDLIIGTHRLLSQDVVFNDLGLVVVDEEQRFGVEHKESLLRLRLTVDVLTLSATPIPRTLHMSMLGLRDISSLTTPPADRRAIVTEVIPYNARRVQQAIERELSREGQVFVVHNRVHDIRSFADDIQQLAPKAKIVVGHGQMGPHELEEVMLTFIRGPKEGGADILVSTTIIESGIDIANANTMIIHEADRFGLSDLHQLRGRVGRGKHRGYCYLLLPEDRSVRETAQKRLKALEQYSMLGAGFKIAMRDLEIRGAGNILGAEQSGHIAQVGYEMFCRLLEDAVHELKHEEKPRTPSSTSVEIGVSGHFPKAYIPSDKRRLGAYRRVATARTREDVDRARVDITQAYGQLPQPSERLLELAELRIALNLLDVRTVSIREKDVIFLCKDCAIVARELASRATTQVAKEATITPLPPEEGSELDMVYFRPPANTMEPTTLLRVLRARMGLHSIPAAVPDTKPKAKTVPAQTSERALSRSGGSGSRRGAPPRGTRSRPPGHGV